MAKRKWSWKHRLFIKSNMLPSEYHALIRFCADKFGPDFGDYNQRWDHACRKIGNRDYGYIFHNVQLFFKHQEDAVLFKLSYDSSVLDG